jgi:hypothetical protein
MRNNENPKMKQKFYYRLTERLSDIFKEIVIKGTKENIKEIEIRLKELGINDTEVSFSTEWSASKGYKITNGKGESVFVKKDGTTKYNEELLLLTMLNLLYAYGVGAKTFAFMDGGKNLCVAAKDVHYSQNSKRENINDNNRRLKKNKEQVASIEILRKKIEQVLRLWDIGSHNTSIIQKDKKIIKFKIFDFAFHEFLLKQDTNNRDYFTETDFPNRKMTSNGELISKNERTLKSQGNLKEIKHHVILNSIRQYAELHNIALTEEDVEKILSLNLKGEAFSEELEKYDKEISEAYSKMFELQDKLQFSELKTLRFLNDVPKDGLTIEYIAQHLGCETEDLDQDLDLLAFIEQVNTFINVKEATPLKRQLLQNLKDSVKIEGGDDRFYENLVALNIYNKLYLENSIAPKLEGSSFLSNLNGQQEKSSRISEEPTSSQVEIKQSFLSRVRNLVLRRE